MITIDTNAERQAVKAEELSAFSGLKLLHIKRNVAEILKQVGGEGIFDTYTRHDISHIDAMLKALDWPHITDNQGHNESGGLAPSRLGDLLPRHGNACHSRRIRKP